MNTTHTKRAAFYTLGCKVNQYETEAMEELFSEKGYEIVGFDDFADVYVINTCTVTGMSDRKSRQIIRRAKKINPNSVVAVTGCYAQTAPDAVRKIDGVNIIIGTQDRKKIVELAENAASDSLTDVVSDIMHTHAFENLSVKTYHNRTRAYIKVQEGCNQFCSYCIIPYARGPIRSRPFDEVMAEIRRLSSEGFSEIILAGIHVASYGADIGGIDLADLIIAANKIDGIKRIRLSSIEPMTLSRAFIKRLKDADKLCHHFHLSLQSGCDETLRRMNRKYTCSQYKEIVDALRENYPDVAITTDIMVGFPGETDEEFAATAEFVENISFSDAHIFQYSPRKGTPAASRSDQVNPSEKERRSKVIDEVTRNTKHEFLSRFLGTTAEVLFEQPSRHKDGFFEGKTENYITVSVPTDLNLSGQFHKVELLEITPYGIDGRLVD